ncbi:MAG: CRISPR-associated endonuclease Cas1, partial [Devosiaceae bacterium]|nr:CRISPR-associated endonuclease Cas1 [Devosiaceae bacterium]
FRFLGHLFVRSMVVKSAIAQDENQVLQLMQKVAQEDFRSKQEIAIAQDKLLRKRRAGLDPGLRVLYVMEAGRRLSIRNEAFSVEEKSGNLETGYEWREILALPNKDVDRIEIGPKAEVDNCAIDLALASDTPLAFVNGWGETKGWVAPRYGAKAKRHLLQAKLISNEEKRLDLARRFVDGRIRNQRALLRRLNRKRKNPQTLKNLSEINTLIRRVPHEKSLASLMGVEGRATALYWPALGRNLEYGFSFSTRDRRGEISGVNIMFNMCANMLARDVSVCLERAGLHIGFGVLHETYGDRDALAYDLMEEFRAPLCESVVISAINTRAVGQDMFSTTKTGKTRMTSSATRALIRHYEMAISRPIKSQRQEKDENGGILLVSRRFY